MIKKRRGNNGGQGQLPFDLGVVPESTVSLMKANETSFRDSVILFSDIPVRSNLPSLVLPIRFENLEAEAKVRNLPLRPLLKPVQDALKYIEREIQLVQRMATGRLCLINGITGSGKTTFLNSLILYFDGIRILPFKDDSLETRSSVEKALTLLSRPLDAYSIVVMEGREAPGSFRDAELDILLTTLNADFRTEAGRKTLFVIPTTSVSLAQTISERAATIGGMTSGSSKPFYVFTGPSKHEYVPIVNEAISAFNDSRTLLDYGVSDQLAKDISEASAAIGQFIESCHREIMENQRKLEDASAEVRHKRIHLWMVFCSSEEDLRRSHDIVRALTVGGTQRVQVPRILFGDSREVREWQQREANFAQIANYLDLRILYLPMRTAVAIAQAYAPQDLMAKLKSKGLMQRETPRVRAQESLANSAIGRFLSGQSYADDPSRRGKLDPRQQELFRELMLIAVEDETILNAMVAQTLRESSPAGTSVITEMPLVPESRSLLVDIAVVNSTDIYCLEMKWRSSQLTDSEVIRSTAERVSDFAKNLVEIKGLAS